MKKIPAPKYVLDAPLPAQTVESWPAPLQPQPGEAALLEEAFRFFDDSRELLLSRVGASGLKADGLKGTLEPLRWRLHDDLFAYFAMLRTGKDGRDSQKPNFLAHMDPPISVIGFASQARMIVRVLTLGSSRRDWADGLLSNRVPRYRKQRESIRFRRFEKLDEATSELRGLVTRAAVENALTASFGSVIVDPWGGLKAIKRDARPVSNHAKGGYVEHEIFGVRLSQKIREQFLTKAFQPAHRDETEEPPPIAATVQDAPPFTLHVDVHERVDRLERELMVPHPFGLPVVGDALDDLRRLTVRYAVAGNLPSGADVGLAWGAALASVLRAYLVDLVAHLTMIALPAERAQRELDGYLGVALHELMTGELAEHVNRTGYVARLADHPILQALSSWKVAPFVTGWPAGVAQHGAVGPELTELAKKPVLVPRHFEHDRVTKKRKEVLAHATTFDDWRDTWRQYPITGAEVVWRRADDEADPYVGAHLSAQCHLYVANALLRVPIQDLGLPSRTADYDGGFQDQDEDAADLQLAPGVAAQALQLIAGSSLWDARKPPHKTHNDGASFDLRFGADTPVWAIGGWGEVVNDYMRARLGGVRDAYVIATHHWALDAKGKPVLQLDPQEDRVFAAELGSLIEARLKDVRQHLQGPTAQAEWDDYDKLEKQLKGTPQVLWGAGTQALLAGIIAILLSGPTQVIHSSPILYARGMQALRRRLPALTGSAPASTTQKALVEALKADFVFMPFNHHHHWHVHYNEDRLRPMDKEEGLARVERFLDLWLLLGVDFTPFVDYLGAIDVNPSAPEPHLTRVTEERDELIALLENTVPDPNGRATLRNVFMACDRGEPLVEPPPGDNLDYSPELQAIIDATAQMQIDAEAWGFERTRLMWKAYFESLNQVFQPPGLVIHEPEL